MNDDNSAVPDEDDDKHFPISDILENEDGSATVKFDDRPTPVDENPEFYANLAESIPSPELNKIGMEISELIEKDVSVREGRDKIYAEGIRRTGFGNDAPGGAKFRGASKVVHPMMTEACIDFSAKIIGELFPRSAQGPVKDFIPGEVTKDKVDKAKRKTRYLNWQLTQEMPEFRGELEQGLTQEPLGGAFYVKMYWDVPQDRIRPLIIYIDDLILPYSANSFLGAERITHRQILTKYEFQRRVQSGLYVDIGDLSAPLPDETQTQAAIDKVQGAEPEATNEDGTREIYEVQTFWTIEGDFPSPYIITIDKISKRVLAVYRNWEENDEKRLALEHIVEFPFQPFRGPYPIGLPHLIGGLSAASTGALRAILDSAHLNNAQAALKLKGGGKGGQNADIIPGEIKEIEGAVASTDPDIRKVVMPIPANPPSNVLLELLGMLTEAGRGVVRTSMEDLPDKMGTNMPVGTTLALIEQGMTVFSAIHARNHDAFGRLLKVMHRLNRQNIVERIVYDETGELMVRREDFEGPIDVIPVSDPNVFSAVQRATQSQFIAQRQMVVPGLYDPRAVEERLLEDAKIPNAKALLVPKPEANKLNAINENIAASRGQPVVAFPQQDHLAHIQIHLDFMKSPFLGMNPIIAPKFIPAMLDHIAEHITFYYLTHVYEIVSQQLGMEPEVVMKLKDDEVDNQFEQLLAMASQLVVPDVEKAFQGIPPIIQQAQTFIQQNMPPPPMDPAAATLQVAKMQNDTEQAKIAQQSKDKQTDNVVRLQTAKTQQQTATATAQLTAATAEKNIQKELALQTMEDQTKRDINAEDNATAMHIAHEKIENDMRTNLQNGNSLGEE